MKQKSKTIIGLLCSSMLILIVFVFFVKNDTIHNSYGIMSFSNIAKPKFGLEEPNKYEESFQAGNYGATFISYEDFPLQIPPSTSITDLKLINIPNGIWVKIIQNKENTTSDSSPVLRIMGAVKPLTPVEFNNTLFTIIPDHSKNMSYVAATNIIQNRIIEEISPIRISLPVKFKNEMFSYRNSTITHILGVVYDNNPMSSLSIHTNSTNKLYVNITPIGMMYNGSLTNFPSWLKVNIDGLPKILNQDQPTYYLIHTITTNAPVGSYQIALRETIGNENFIETITNSVVG